MIRYCLSALKQVETEFQIARSEAERALQDLTAVSFSLLRDANLGGANEEQKERER